MRLALDARTLLHEKTEYQDMRILEHAFLGRVLALDGILQTTTADEFIYHEMMTHVALLGRSTPAAAVLVVGGGDGGVLREVLRHDSVRRAVMVDLDGRVVEATAKHLGLNGDYDDPRVTLEIGDGAAFAREAAARGERFDAVIVDSTDPIGPGARLFTDAFVCDLAACLEDDGVMVRQAGIPFHQREEMPAAFHQAARILGTGEVFRASIPTYIGGDMAFVAGLRGGGSLATPRDRFEGRYYNAEVHRAAFALPNEWRERLVANAAAPRRG